MSADRETSVGGTQSAATAPGTQAEAWVTLPASMTPEPVLVLLAAVVKVPLPVGRFMNTEEPASPVCTEVPPSSCTLEVPLSPT